VIGEPIPDLRLRLLDARGDLVPVGVPGEIHVVGGGLARGYLARPDLTAERFVPDAYSKLPGERSYRSGDLARWRPASAGDALDLEYLGRIDFQVKIRGFRIELGEIEAALTAHPDVREAVVVVDGEGDDRRLIGYLVPAGSLPEAELREHLRARLPEHMVPALLIPLPALPLTPNGKVDKKALPAPEVIDLGAGLTPPGTPLERRLAGIWESLLGVSGVGLESEFFALGGHSLLAMRLSSHLRDAIGLDLPVTAVFEAPVFRAFVELVLSLGASLEESDGAASPEGAGRPALARIPRAARTGPLPLSHAQARLWLFDRMRPGSTFYNMGGVQRLAGRLRLDRLDAAIAEVVARHESLRTSFSEVDTEPVQIVHSDLVVRARMIDLSGLAQERTGLEMVRLSARQVGLPFDLGRPPLLRLWLVRLGAEGDALLYMMHHIVSDGWSMGVLVSELSAAYDALAAGRGPELGELPVQYPDFAVWQRSWIEGGELARQLGYWRGRLAGSRPTELPADHPRPLVSTYRGRRFRASISGPAAASLAALAREHRASTFMLLLAGFETLVARWSGETDVVIGAPIANRQRREVEGLIGFFVNTLVLRTDLAGDPSFAAALERTKETALGAFAHQDLPFERLVEELAPRRDPARHPLFQLLFNLVNTPGDAQRVDGSVAREGENSAPDLQASTALFDLQLFAVEAPGAYRLYWEYSTDLFEESTIRRLARGFEILMAAAGERPETRWSELPLLSAAEVAELSVQPEPPSAAPYLLHRRFEERAAADPQAPAATHEGETLSYADLEARANRLARRLRALGVGPEARVALCLERTLDLAVTILAVLKAGGAYVPLDPAYPADRLGFILADAEASVAVTRSELADSLPARGARLVLLDREDLSEESEKPLADSPAPDNAAYVIYTSGSTGRPKGVVVTHANVARLFEATDRWFGFGPSDVWTLFHSYAFDFSVWEIWGALLYGGRLVVVPYAVSRSPRDFRALLARERVTVLNQTPSAFYQLDRADEEAEAEAAPLALRTVVFGGEALDLGALSRWFGRHPETPRLVNMYGITETTVHVTYRPISAREAAAGSVIGEAIPDLAVRLLDARGELVPLGVPGDLHVVGGGLARGYLARPDLTAERFVPDATSRVAGARSYRSGDLARWRPAAGRTGGRDLEYLGRIDLQVKIRGFRIELGEIEAALTSHGSVRAAVAVVDGEGETRRLVGYVVPAGESLAEGELREHLRSRLPEHMVPALLIPLPSLPLTPNGKVDKKALPKPEVTAAGVGLTPPGTALERRLAEIWENLLGVSGVGLESEFFALGGHSLLAMRMASRLREALSFEIPVQAIFEEPTLGALARRIESEAGSLAGDFGVRGAPALVARPTDRRAGPLPVSYDQARLWLLDRLIPGRSIYNIGGVHRFGGRVRDDLFRAAIDRVVRRHETLRTSFAEIDLEPVQTIHPEAAVRPRRIDLSALAAGPVELARVGALEVSLPFDLSRPPLLRLSLVRLGAEDALLYVIHHIVSDAWSMGILISELGAAYAALAAGRVPDLPELPVQYADFALWQRDWFERGELTRQLGYWRDRLAGAPATELPTDRQRPPVTSYRGRRFRTSLAAEFAAPLLDLGRGVHASAYMVLLAGFEAVVARYVGQDDVVVGMPIANRRRREVEGLIGFFVNTLVLRTDLSLDPSFEEAVGRTRETALGAFAHPDLPFERLVEELAPRRDLSRNPLFQLMFNLVNATPTEAPAGGRNADRPAAAGLAGGATDSVAATALFDLHVYLVETAGSFDLHWEYSADLFEDATIRRFARAYETLLGGAAARPAARLSALPLLSPSERAELVGAGTGAAARAPLRWVHRRIAERAAQTPAAIAVVAGASTLTYGELQARANRLARRLRRFGVGVESRVGIAVDRCVALPVAVLGVLGAGASYVPLDPAYPAERLAFMADDADLAVLIVSEEQDEARFAAYAPVLVRIAPDGTIEGEEEATPPPVELDALNLVYTIYTSGSTGRPKGVALSHGALANLGDAMIERPGFAADDVLVGVASLSFDMAGVDLYPPLLAGARYVIARREETTDGRLLRELIERSGATLFQATPSGWRVLLASGWPGDPRLKALIGGEALPPALAAELLSKVGSLWNMYGPTETAVWSTFDPVGQGPITIGKPIAATGTYVVDRNGDLLPAGVPGELWIGGAGVARGYHARPDLTAERFLPNAFAAEPGARLYRTGDLARWRTDGEPGRYKLECLGRIDNQVKVRGHRIELGEIEAVLAGHPAVAGSSVVLFGEGEDRRLAAYVVVRPGEEPESLRDELRPYLLERLPESMLPSVFVRLEALPLNPSGKVDRKALPAPEIEVGSAATPPRTPLERELAAIWEALLGVSGLGLESHFFALGGHSLLAMRLSSRLREAFALELPLQVIFEAPVLGPFAERVEAALAGSSEAARLADEAAAPALVPIERSGPLPLSFAQGRLWVLDRLAPGNPFYNLGGAVRFDRRLRGDLLAAAVAGVVARQEALRTRFSEVDGEPAQTVLPAVEVRPREIDLSGQKTPGPEALRLGALLLAQPFDLGRPPLLRIWRVRLGASDDALLYAIHHIIADAWSLGLLTAEITASYAALAAGKAPVLPPLPVQYADFAYWQRSWFAGGELDRQLAYWRERLTAAPSTELPTDRPRPPVATFRGRGLRTALGPDRIAPAARLARARQASPYMVLLTAFSALISRYGAQEEIVVGTPIANRQRREVEQLIGFFINTLVLRTDLSGDPTFGEALARTRETALGAFAHQDMPFERLVEELSPRRDLARNPFFQLMFNLINTPAAEGTGAQKGSGGAVDERALDVRPTSAPFDLQLYLSEAAESFQLYWEYAADLFEEATMRRLARAYETLIAGAVARPEARLSDLPLLDASERTELLAAGTGVAAGGPGLPVHERIAAQARRTPKSIAVVAGSGTLTYTELQARANRLARRLRRLGVGVESRVGIAVERSLALPVATLGVLGAGGSYVPLDPAYPAERLAYMAADAGLAAVIVSDDLAGVERFAAFAPIVVPIRADGSVEGREKSTALPLGLAAENLAYTIYTSGSTGRPKGVELSHGALANFLDAMIERPGLGPKDVWVAVTSLSFDIAGLELYAPLMVGARTVIARPDEVQGGALLGDLLRASGATHLQATPSGWRVLLGSGWPGDPNLVALVGGEALPPALALALCARVKTLWNMYGPTETAVWSAVDEVGAGPISIGRPIAATGLYVVDAHGGLLPPGVPGELWIGGAGVARGYRGRPDLTAERFLPDGYSGVAGARLYRTGDLARRLPDGRFECLGRIDTQVKVRGFRIELGEIEAALAADPQIAQAVVVARADGASPERELVAYFVAKGSEADRPTAAELRARLKERLPDYMVPTWFVPLDALPMTPNGKIDRKALPDPTRGARRGAAAEPPGTATEKRVAAIWAEVLHVAEATPLGLDDDFFDLGGHSLAALKVQAQLERALGRTVEFVALFRHPTVRQLAAALDAQLAQGTATLSSALVPIQPLGTRPPLFVLPPIGGTVYFYRALAQELGTDQPIWGLQSPGIEEAEEPIDDLEAMAAFYLQAIAPLRQPGVPVHLAGASMGGLVVFEMARQLEARGEPVGMAALLDTAGGGATAVIDDRAALMAMVYFLTQGRFHIPAEQLLGLSSDDQIDRVFTEAAARGISTEGVSRERIARLRRVIEANLKARAGYRQQTYGGRLLFCRAEVRLPGEPDRPEISWLAAAQGGVELHDVPGDHDTMLQPPNVARMAEILARKLGE
jgi:amino acid adenylation domain-containing protein